ncbi:MAG: hypothetical protein INH41_25960 [Myxococcaceae bacterium]|jgi:hypothetical protein|nr:hypothetical protein [Myxococcaceae bacterium]MCA3015847.1 hypothetical protein [Myxococcaceae bacterium]
MERRTRRSPRIHEALTMFFDALCLKRSLEAVALTTHDGLLIGGTGRVDLEELGALGAATRKTTAPFRDRELHVNRFEVNDTTLCLTTLGAPVRDDAAVGALMRILAA